MKLRDMLFSDLGGLFGRKRPETPQREWSDLWFMRIFSPPSWRSPFSRHRAVRFDDPKYKPGRYYRSLGKKWTGPLYLVIGHWRRDLLSVTDQIGAIVKTNAPLVKGLEACGREESRQRRGLSARNIFALAEAYAVMSAVILVGIYVGVSKFDLFARLELVSFAYFCLLGAIAAVPGLFFLRRNGRLEAIFLTLRDDLASGISLSEAMRRQNRFFPPFYADMVKAGEETGRLGDCLDQLGEETLHSLTLGKGLVSNFVYLGSVFAVQMTILTFLSLKVLPVFVDILQDFGGGAPGPMRLVITVVDGVFGSSFNHRLLLGEHPKNGAWPIFLGQLLLVVLALMLLALVLTRLRRRFFSTRSIAALFLLVPGIRGMVIHRNLAIVSMVLDKLLRAGVPLDRALESAANTELNPLYKRSVLRVRDRVLQGESLGEAWNAEAGLGAMAPASFRGLVMLGERSGMLPEAFGRLADFYGRMVEKRARILVDALMPLGVLALGGITLTVELAVFVTLTSLYDTLMGSM